MYDARGNGNGETAPTITGDHQNRVTDYTAICVADRSALGIDTYDTAFSILSRDYKAPHAVLHSTVRRLTPIEYERLQGYPDRWTDIGEWTDSKGKLHKESSDSARYAALGNSIALPSWFYVLSKLSEFCEEKTMASLFDGIGGFPLIWETLNGKGSCLWASEIEEFPIAVTKHHFPDEEAEAGGNGG